MALPSIFSAETTQEIIDRINQLQPNTQALWGKMTVDQMLAHCCVTYEMVYENKHPKPGMVGRFFLKLFVKPIVVNEKPYKKSGQTSPAFLVTNKRNFDEEKQRLIRFIQQTQTKGAAFFEGKESHSFGVLSSTEWNNMFYKHLNHHLSQFGV